MSFIINPSRHSGVSSLNPDDLSNLAVWLDPSIESSFNGGSISDLDPVSTVDSISPATEDWTQVTGSDQPEWNDAGMGSNSLPFVKFDRSNGEVLMSSYTQSQAVSFVLVLNMKNSSTEQIIFSTNNSYTNATIIVAGGNITVRNDVTIDEDVDTISIDELVIIKGVFNGTSSFFAKNDGTYIDVDAGSNGFSSLQLGGYKAAFVFAPADMEMGDFVCYNDAKTKAELDSVADGLNAKYGGIY